MKEILNSLFIAISMVMALASCGNGGGKSFGLTSDSSETVYVTEHGKRYHREDCFTIQPPRHNPYAESKSEAESEGRTPCKICWP